MVLFFFLEWKPRSMYIRLGIGSARQNFCTAISPNPPFIQLFLSPWMAPTLNNMGRVDHALAAEEQKVLPCHPLVGLVGVDISAGNNTMNLQ